MYLYAYPVIFFIFACIKGCGIAVKNAGNMQKSLFTRLSEPNYVVKGHIIPTYPKMHNLPVPTVGTDMP
jgi:hypothetical protein